MVYHVLTDESTKCIMGWYECSDTEKETLFPGGGLFSVFRKYCIQEVASESNCSDWVGWKDDYDEDARA